MCKCPDVTSCSSTQSTVCGSDGKTYESTCVMKANVCNRKEDVTVAHSGPCGTVDLGVYVSLLLSLLMLMLSLSLSLLLLLSSSLLLLLLLCYCCCLRRR